MYLYKLTSPDNEIYFGITKDFKRRMNDHSCCNQDKPLYNAISKFGWENFKKEIITVGEEDKIKKLEDEMIYKQTLKGNCLNVHSYLGNKSYKKSKQSALPVLDRIFKRNNNCIN